LRPYLEEKTITKKDWWSGSRFRPRVQAPVPHTQRIYIYTHTYEYYSAIHKKEILAFAVKG
jgi:hypothetical protein